ncbi:MAG TPA: primosomal protein N' [Solirubrobacteraceae bacterium]|nr:primosomal protein N' [Solirubrobacteraceae bacterium]
MSAIAQVEPMTMARALRGPFDYRLPRELRGEVTVGSMLVVPFGRREVLGVVTGLAERSDISEEKLLPPLRALDLGVPVDLVALAGWLADEYCSTLARALTLVLPPAATRRLSGRKRRAAPSRPEHIHVGARSLRPPALTAEQAAAVAELAEALRSGMPRTRLLAGITGSGKTEVYLRVAAEALERGRGAIVLVPEIALTAQIVGRFVERFGDTVAVLHSRLTVAERREEWRRLRVGEARVCVGPRSAVFAPIERLGLIVIDEEHDSSYKHEGDPRYDARTVAARRARDCHALLLLGSATPRPESVRTTGGMPPLRLSHRVDGRPLPQVTVLDMRNQAHGLHALTAQALADVRVARGKAIVLLNRRGWSNFLTCRACGRVWSCPQCDVALVLHRAGGTAEPARSSETGQPSGARQLGHGAGGSAGDYIACHHCGHSEPAPCRCECGSTSVARHGAGTERIQHDLTATLDDGDFPVFRLDADAIGDSPGRDGGVAGLLSRFEAARAGVLIGTQMVAKGHDFADVALGVVLDADATLRFPDFRAEERTFALVTQLAGRVGRGNDGRVLVQTIAPHARSIVRAAAHDSDGFLAGELQRRQALCYPPFSSLVRVVCAAEQVARVCAAAEAVRAGISASAANVLGPAALFRLRGRERRVLVVKAPLEGRSEVISAVGDAVRRAAGARAYAGVSFSVDVDPQ